MSAERLRAMLSKATPGPWRVDERYVMALKEKWVAELPCGGVLHAKVDARNARLIALAPDAIALLADMGETLTALRAQVGITKHADGDTSSMVIGAHSFDAAGVTEILQRLDALCGDDRA